MTVLKSIFLILLLAIIDSTIVNRSTGGEMVCVLIVSNYLLTIIFFPISFKRFSFYTYFLELELGRARNFWYAIYEILDFHESFRIKLFDSRYMGRHWAGTDAYRSDIPEKPWIDE